MINKMHLIWTNADVDLVYTAAIFKEKIYRPIKKTMLKDEEDNYGKDEDVMRKIASSETKGLMAKISYRIHL